MPAEPNKDSPLIFHWPKPLEQERRLAFWIMVVVLGLAAFFYLFQVVYPQSLRRTPVPHQILLLDPSNPESRAILNKVRDRDFLLLPGEEPGSERNRLEEQGPVFHPSYEGHRLTLQDLPHKAFTVPPARLLKVDEPVLPPLDLSELKQPGSPAGGDRTPEEPRLEMVLSGDLASRKLTVPPDLAGISPAYPGGHKFQLVADAEGRVWFVLPLRDTENLEASRSLAERLLKMRFEPRSATAESPGKKAVSGGTSSSPSTGQGTATFRWVKPE